MSDAKPLWRYFVSFFWVWAAASLMLWGYGGLFAFYQGTILSVLELSLSFDNAVVNALILATMALIWRQRFLFWGMLFAVFGIRFVFPILIVYFSTDLSFLGSFELAINSPAEYERLIGEAHHIIMSFGGMFLFMLFVKFLFDEEKELHWIAIVEKYTSRMAKIGDLRMITILALMLGIAYATPSIVPINGYEVAVDKVEILAPMLLGMIIFYAIEFLKGWMEKTKEERFEGRGTDVAAGGFISFVYLELIDMSFSLDGVLGAFAITQNVIVIMLGLGIGAMAVRSLTLFMVDHEVTSRYIYLEHGAMWSIGFLSLSMIVQIFVHLPEALITTVAIVPITLAFIHSIWRNRRLLQERQH